MRRLAVRLVIALIASCALGGCASSDRPYGSAADPGSGKVPTTPSKPSSEPILALFQKALEAQGESKDRLLAVAGQEPAGVSPECYVWTHVGKGTSVL